MSIFSWLKRRRLDEEDFQEEIRAHLAMAARERAAEGEDPESARNAAVKEFGNVTLTTEAAREVWTPKWLVALNDLASDARFAIRALARNPGFSLTVIAVLTLGIGLNAAVFTMIKSFTIAPLAGVEGSGRLAVLFGETTTGREVRVSYPDYVQIRDHASSFSQVFGSSLITPSVGRGRSARVVWGELVTGNYFEALGVRVRLGRTIQPADEIAPGRHPVVVISDGFWRSDFGSDPEILGKTIEINNFPLTVVGVADPEFHGTIVSYDVEVFIPVMMAAELGVEGGLPRASSASLFTDPRAQILFPHARVRRGTSLAAAIAETDALWASLSQDRLPAETPRRLRVVPFWKSPTGAQTYMLPTLIVLSATGLLLLMIACANIAGLVLVRGVSRQSEIAVRLSLGASRTRIVRLLIVENLVLALPGALLGLLLSWRGIPLLAGYAERAASPSLLFFNIEVDGLVIGFAALVACGSALLFGFFPALRSSRVELVSVMKDASPRSAARGRLRTALVVAQVAVSLMLLVGAGLVNRSFEAARSADPGFDASQVTIIEVDLRQNAYDEARGRQFYRDLLDLARADVGIESATLATFIPLGTLDTREERVEIEGHQPRPDEDLAFMTNSIGPDYFRTLRARLLAGREFESRDDEDAQPVVIVNETFANRFWGGAARAIGKRFRVAGGEWRTVVGVAADLKYSRINESPRPYIYLPFLQAYRPSMILHTRGAAPIHELVEQARAHVVALDGELPILLATPMAERVKVSFGFYNFTANMLFLFGVSGMALAAMGTYGLVSYTVRQSTHEIGIRMALGASGPIVVRGFLGRGLRLGAIGALLGILAALGISRLLGSVLFGVTATDPASFATALAVVLGGVLLATLIPAWRASRTNPLAALRHQ